MRTLVLSDGSIVKAVDIDAIRLHQHFFSHSYYIRIELRGGLSRDVAEHLPRDAAQSKKAELVTAVQAAIEEVSAVEYVHDLGFAAGKSEGRSEGVAEGRSQGYQEGWSNGRAEYRRSISAATYQKREVLIQEQKNNVSLTRGKRRHIKNMISVLTDLIQYLSNEEPSI